ncbi:MAG: hypothetical protein AVDCRST_MAG90-3176, partial [uncultured Microvirga sp.]
WRCGVRASRGGASEVMEVCTSGRKDCRRSPGGSTFRCTFGWPNTTAS